MMRIPWRIYLGWAVLAACLGPAAWAADPSAEAVRRAWDQMERLSPALARELSRLPEIRDRVSADERRALAALLTFHAKHPAEMDAWLAGACGHGGPRRAYCTPLQALFWRFLDGRHGAGLPAGGVLPVIRTGWAGFAGARWRDFDTVSERLNDPVLVQYYVRENFRYDGDLVREIQEPEDLFRSKVGVCRDFAAFATHCLTRAGYDAKNLTAWWGDGWETGHTVAVAAMIDGVYIVMDSNRYRELGMVGPFPGYLEAARAIVSGPFREMRVETNRELIDRNRDAYR